MKQENQPQKKIKKPKALHQSKHGARPGTAKANRNQLLINHEDKKNKNFMYQNFTKAKCFGSDFSHANFDYVCFRGAHLKSSNFIGCSFKNAEFIGSNLKDCSLVGAAFENTLFEGARFQDVDFKDATFKNTLLVGCDLTGTKHLAIEAQGLRVYDTMPDIEMSLDLKTAWDQAMANPYVKKSRVFDTKEGQVNTLSLMLLLETFDEVSLIEGLVAMLPHIDRDFYTLSFVTKLIQKLKET